ncbi:MAG: glycosyltransferase family 4 protein, partial [Verrucomicrobiia bacterium]
DLSHTELVWFRWWQFPRLLSRLFTSAPLFFRFRETLREEIEIGGLSPKSAVPSSSSADDRQSEIRNQKSEIPLVHLNSSTLAVAALAARSLGLPVVWHIREPLARGYLGFRRALLRATVRRCSDAVIAICENDAAQLGPRLTPFLMEGHASSCPSASNSCTHRPPLHVIHNFVDFTQFDATRPKGALRKDLGIPEESPILLFLGGSALTKGAGILIEAASQILSRTADAHLVVAGESVPEFTTTWIHGVAAGLRRRVHLLGVRMDVPALLADTALLLFPSTVPHFARPVIEAAAMGVPCVASDLGGVRELILPGETGVLVRAGDSVLLADTVVALLADPAHRQAMGRKALALARERFDAKKNAARTFAVYEELSPAPM